MNTLIKTLITILITNQSYLFAKEINNDYLPVGKWKIEKQFSSKRKVNIELNIKYSKKHKRYFGSILDFFWTPYYFRQHKIQ